MMILRTMMMRKIIDRYPDFLLNEKKKNLVPGDKVLIEYWYNDMITPVIIKERKGNRFLVSHDVEGSEIRNAPEEYVPVREVIPL